MTIPNPATTDWVPLWDTGATGGGMGSIPGEIKMWSGASLPAARYGKWVWADGAIYDEVTYPEAAASISPAWKTAHGAADPGAGKFRVPDMRGVTPFGMDAMPGGSRANRMVRAIAATLAGRTGEENHVITTAETPAHAHGASGLAVNSHSHGGSTGYVSNDHTHQGSTSITAGAGDGYDHLGKAAFWAYQGTSGISANHYHAVNAEAPGINGSTANAGGGGAHENVPPAIFVPWIVRLDG